MDWDKTSKSEFLRAGSETSEESTQHVNPREEAENKIKEAAQRRLEELFRENAAEMTARSQVPVQEFDAPTLDLTPPINVVDRSTERQPNMTREQTAASIQEAAQTRQEEFNTKARPERTSPYIRENTDKDQDQGDGGFSL
jgi:hypothetical protein